MGNLALDDKKEDDWEKLSRISRRTAQNKKPVNLDTIEDKIKTLHTLQIDMGRKKPSGTSSLTLENDKDRTHSTFLDQKVPLSERYQGETDSASASVKNQKQVSIFFDIQSQQISSKEGMIKFFEEHQEKKRRNVELSSKIKQSQEVSALLDKDYKTTKPQAKKRLSGVVNVDSSTTEPTAGNQSNSKPRVSTETPRREKLMASKALGAVTKTKASTDEKGGRGLSLTSMSTSKGASVISTKKPTTPFFGSSKTPSFSKTSALGKLGTKGKK